MRIALAGYMTALVAVTMTRLLATYLPSHAVPNLTPFAGVRGVLGHAGLRSAVQNVGGNLLMFVPFGVLVPLLWKRMWSLWRIALASLALSCAIETWQFYVLRGARKADIDDVILNTAGGIVGYAVLCAFAAWRRRRNPRVA